MKQGFLKRRFLLLGILGILFSFSQLGSAQKLNNDLLTEPLTEKLLLGDSLIIGEKCLLDPRLDIQQSKQSQQVSIICNGIRSGTLNSEAELMAVTDEGLQDRLKQTLKQFAQSKASVVVSSKMECREPKWLEQSDNVPFTNPPILAIPCELINGGWPQLVLLRSDGRKLYTAEGPPSSLPILIKAITYQDKIEIPSANLTEQTRRLKTVWGKSIRFYNPKDIELYSKILAEARVANSLGKYEQSETLFRRALEIESQLLGEDSETLITTLLDLALNVSNNERFEEAAGLFRRAEVLVQKSVQHSDKGRYYSYLGYDAANRRAYKDALKYSRASVTEWRKATEDDNLGLSEVFASQTDDADNLKRGELAMALNFQANMLLRNEDVVGAYKQAGDAFKMVDEIPSLPVFWKTQILVTLGDVSIAQGRISAAVTYYKTALAYQRKSYGDSTITVNILAKLGLGLQDEGLNTESIITFRETVQVAKSLPNGSRGALNSDQLSNYAEAAIAIAPSFTKKEDQQGLFAEVFEAMQLQNSSVIDKTIALATARMKVSDPEISKMVDDLQSNERLRDAAKSQLAAETALANDQRSKVVEDDLNQQITERNQTIDLLRADIEKKYPEYADLVKGKVIKVNEVQSYLSPKEAVVSFLLGNQASYIQLVTRENISLVQIPMTMDQISEEIKNLRKGLEVQRGTVNEFDLASSNNLYKNIFGKLENELKDVDHLIVIPTGPLASIPFGILVSNPVDKGNYVQANWLANRFAITHAPSLAAFYSKRSTDPIEVGSKPFLGFGNPVLGPVTTQTSRVTQVKNIETNKNIKKVSTQKPEDQKEITKIAPTAVEFCRTDGPIPAEILTAMPSLPDTALELQQIGKLVGKGKEEIYQGQQANESNLRNLKLMDYRIIYFATHGLLPGELRCQSEPAIVLSPAPSSEKNKFKHSDGLIDASEISQLKLNADLVVLSACNTAGGNGKFGGEALSGLTEAFFFAGAQNMLVSHWSVPSSATMKLMTSMFANLGPKLENGTASSLQKAQQQMIKNVDTSHPVFWGAFVLIGDGAEPGVGVSKTDKIQAKIGSSAITAN